MKSAAQTPQPAAGPAAAIVHLAGSGEGAGADPLARARAFAEPLLAGQLLDTGEDALAHADGVAGVLAAIGGAPPLCAAAYLVYAADYLQRPDEVLRKAFGDSYAGLVALTRKLVQLQRAARDASLPEEQRALQTERIRKMLLAFSRDLRVVLLRLASRLQTLRWMAATRTPCPETMARESQQVFARLANRLGIWQIKWELEDLSFRFLQPQRYHEVARLVDERRAEREAGIEAARTRLQTLLGEVGLRAEVHGRPKHLYSIWKKMQGKNLSFERVYDVRALRVIVEQAADCYAALARVHEAWRPVDGELDDYIARPKPNGYQSLHTVVLDDEGRPLEVQIRTREMHEHAEHGVAAHWMYKEAGVKGYAGVSADGPTEERIAEARKSVLRELLAWQADFAESAEPGGAPAAGGAAPRDDERIYVFTPQATIIDLPVGGTPVDFAYSLHTDLGHRCRGARVDGQLVPLNTPLRSGQTVEIVAAKEGGPSLDWLNADAGYLASPRARAKVRAWFNLQQQAETIARGREAVEKLLAREGRSAMRLDALAEQLGFADADALFAVVGKDEYSLRHVEQLLRPAAPAPDEDTIALRRPQAAGSGGGVLVVGVDSLLTNLARCCRPAPPDAIAGFVTRGRGVAVHRRDCSNLRSMRQQHPGRVIDVAWGVDAGDKASYPLDVLIEAGDRPGLLRDISDLFAKEKMHIVAVQSQTSRSRGETWMTVTVEVGAASRLPPVLAALQRVPGVRRARRR